jgi:DNA polymerase III subunit gamma/tau
MASVLQRMAVCQQVPGSHDVQDSEATQIARLAALMPADETQLLYSIAIHGRSELGLAPDEYTGLTMSLLRLLAFKPKGFRPTQVHAAGTAPIAEAEKKSLKPEPAPEPAALAPAKVAVAAQSASTLTTALAAVPVISESKTHQSPTEYAQNASDLIASKAPPLADRQVESVVRPAPNPTPASHLLAVPIREQGAGSSRLDSRIAAVEPDAHHEAWVALVQQLLDAQAVQGMVQQLAVQSQCVEKGAAHLTLRVGQPSLKSESARDALQSALAAFGRQEALVIEVGPVQDSWARRNTARLEAKQKAAEQLITQDPWVQELMAQWGAKIVPGSIKAV